MLSKKFKAPRLGAASLCGPTSLEMAEILDLWHPALNTPLRLDGAARIVRCYLDISNIQLPRWRSLSQIHLVSTKLALFGIAAEALGVNSALTFNISDEQRMMWQLKYGNITQGFNHEVLNKVRHLFSDGVIYWFVVEPKIARGKKAAAYARESGGNLCRYDIHMAIKIDQDDQMKAFQVGIWKRAMKLKEYAEASLLAEQYPLYMNGRMARMKHIRNSGWARYCRKGVASTLRHHGDVTGGQPFGAARKVIGAARSLYNDFRTAVANTPLDPSYLKTVRDALDDPAYKKLRWHHRRAVKPTIFALTHQRYYGAPSALGNTAAVSTLP